MLVYSARQFNRDGDIPDRRAPPAYFGLCNRDHSRSRHFSKGRMAVRKKKKIIIRREHKALSVSFHTATFSDAILRAMTNHLQLNASHVGTTGSHGGGDVSEVAREHLRLPCQGLILPTLPVCVSNKAYCKSRTCL